MQVALNIAVVAVVLFGWTPFVLHRTTGRFKLFPSDSLLEMAGFGLSIGVLVFGLISVNAGLGASGIIALLLALIFAALQFVLSGPPAEVAKMRMRVVGLKSAKSSAEIVGSYRLLIEFRGRLGELTQSAGGFGKMHVNWLSGEVARRIAELEGRGKAFQVALGESHLKDGKFEDAGVAFLAGEAHDRAALAYASVGKFDKAVQIVTELRPANIDDLLTVLEQAGRNDLCTQLAELYKDHARLVSYYQRTDRYLEAAQLLEHRLNRLDDAADVYFKAQAWDDALRLYSDLGEHERVADIALERGDYPRAAKAYEALGLTEKAAEAYQRAGQHDQAAEIFRDEGRFEKAAQSYTAMMDYKQTAEMFTRGREFDKAAEAYELGGDHRNAADHYVLAGMHQKAAEIAAEGKIYDKAADIYLGLEEWVKAGQMYELAKHFTRAADAYKRAENFEKAADCYAHAGSVIKAANMYAEFGSWPKAGHLYEQGQRWDRAVSAYRKAGDQQAVARCLVQTGDTKKAAEAYEASGQFEQAAEMYAAGGDIAKAAEMWQKVGKPDKAAELYRESGKFDQALALYKQLGKLAEAATILVDLERYAEAATLFEQVGDFAKAGNSYRLAKDLDSAVRAFESCGEFASAAELFFEQRNIKRAIYFLERAGTLEANFDRLLKLSFGQSVDALVELDLKAHAILMILHYLSSRPSLAVKFHEKVHQMQADAAVPVSDLQRTHIDLIMSFWTQDYPILRARLVRLTEELEIQFITSGDIEEKKAILVAIFPYFAGLVAAEGPNDILRGKIDHYFEEYLDLCGMYPPAFEVLRYVLCARVVFEDYPGATELLPFVERIQRTPYLEAFKELIGRMEKGDVINATYNFRESLNTVLAERPTGRIVVWHDVDDLSRSVYHPETLMIRSFEDVHMHGQKLEEDFKKRQKEGSDRIKIASRSDRMRDFTLALDAINSIKHHPFVLRLEESELKSLYHSAAELMKKSHADAEAMRGLTDEYQAVFQATLEV